MSEENLTSDSAEMASETGEEQPASFKEKRERFFARREGAFLWLLAPPVLIVAILVLVTILLWLGRQVGVLSTLATP